MSRGTTIVLLLLVTCSGCAGLVGSNDPEPATASMVVPHYTQGGDLLRPERYEDWVFVGASVGLGYREETDRKGPGLIHNVQMQPEAYAHYAASGEFPEKTMFVLTLYEPKQKESIAREGFFSGDLAAVEVAVKDHERFDEGWAYFDFGKADRESARPFPRARCHDCHAKHAEQDNVFVQFYPVLRRLRDRGE